MLERETPAWRLYEIGTGKFHPIIIPIVGFNFLFSEDSDERITLPMEEKANSVYLGNNA